jgi:hypothetical protein
MDIYTQILTKAFTPEHISPYKNLSPSLSLTTDRRAESRSLYKNACMHACMYVYTIQLPNRDTPIYRARSQGTSSSLSLSRAQERERLRRASARAHSLSLCLSRSPLCRDSMDWDGLGVYGDCRETIGSVPRETIGSVPRETVGTVPTVTTAKSYSPHSSYCTTSPCTISNGPLSSLSLAHT